jgi:hypothetical protein
MVVKEGQLQLSPYGRHRRGPDGSLFALGLDLVPERFLPGIYWFYNRHLGLSGDRSFGIGRDFPFEAAFALAGYREDIVSQNPAEIFGRTLVDERKGFYLFRNQWQDGDDFVASIYLQRQPLGGSWSFPDVGSFRIRGLGEEWAKAGPGDKKREGENVVVLPHTKTWDSAQPTFWRSSADGSGIVSLKTNSIVRRDGEQKVGIAAMRSFAVDYSGTAGVPGLFVVADKFIGSVAAPDFRDKAWVMNTKGDVTIKDNTFLIRSPSGATMQGTFVAPAPVKLSWQQDGQGKIIRATGGDQFLVVMTVQRGSAPPVKVAGTGLDAQIQVGDRLIFWANERIVLSK